MSGAVTRCEWIQRIRRSASFGRSSTVLLLLLLLLLLLKSVEFDDDVALLLSVAGLVMGPHVTSESEI